MQVYKAGDNELLELVHVVLRLRSDILAQACHKGLEISEDAVMACIPDSLFMFIQLVLGGQSLFYFDTDLYDSVEQFNKAKAQNITFSLAQDLVYNVTGGKNWTPKHNGLASTWHQTTRSKELVDNALAESTLKSMNTVNGAVVPPNLVSNRFIHFTCDNIDTYDSSLEGRNSFHATQVAAWQRGPALNMGLHNLKPLKESTT